MEDYNPFRHCRVCGLDGDFPWGEDGLNPDWCFCACCGVESGYQDGTPEAARRYRELWIANGAKWFAPEEKPDGWSLEAQLKLIPPGFR